MQIQRIKAADLKGKIDFAIVTIREDEEEAILDLYLNALGMLPAEAA